MKNKFLKFGAIILICCSFLLASCVPTGGGDGEIDSDVTNIANNAQDVYNTKDNVTIYKDKNGNNNNGKGAEVFGGAIVFIDPGSEGIFTDHFTGNDVEFKNLVDRQIMYMSEIISQSLGDFYIKSKPFSSIPRTLYKFLETPEINGETKMYDLTQLIAEIDVDNYNYLTAVAQIISDGSLPKVAYDDGTDVEKSEQYLNFEKAIYGGLKRIDVNGNNVFTGVTDDQVLTSYNLERKWKMLDVYGIDIGGTADLIDILKKDLKMQIASALSGTVLSGSYSSDLLIEQKYNEMLDQIDHLGFTETDVKNVVNNILQGVIGKTAVDYDEDLYKELLDVCGGSKVKNPEPNQDFRDYKAYSVVVNEIVNKTVATEYVSGTTTGEDGSEVTNYDKIFIGFPRINIINVDSDFLLDEEETESEDSEGGTEMGDTGYTIPDVDPSEFEKDQKTTLDEKFDKNMKIMGVLLMPNEVTGDRTMAKKENGEWVYESDGTTIAKDEFEVNGFLVTSMEVSLLCEADKYALIQTDFLFHTPTATVTASTDVMEVSSVKPQVDDDNFTYSADFMDAQTVITTKETESVKLKSGEEKTLSSLRIGGYNGISINDLGDFVLSENVVSKGKGSASENNKYTTYQLNTNLYKYIGISDVNGENDTNYAGCLIDLTNFAGDNYVQANFSVLSVNDNDFDRNINFNMLCFMAYAY